MSLKQFLAGVRFRSNYPTFEVGEETSGYVTGQEDGTPLIRIGDTVLRLEGESASTDARVRFRVTAFEAETATGEAELLDIVAGPD